MKIIIDLIDKMENELNDAEDYAELYLDNRDNEEHQNYYLMCLQKLDLANRLHDMASDKISKLEKVIMLNQTTSDLWKYSNDNFKRKSAWIETVIAK